MLWFALQVRRRYERLAAAALRGKGYEEFLPTYKCRRRWSDRVRVVDSPLFPGYVFCKLDPAVRLPILTTPGVVSIAGIGKIPVPVDDSEIRAIQTVVNTRVAVEPWPYFQHGERVRIDTGPLRGVEGILVECKGQHRLVVSLTLLQRSIAVEVDSDSVTPLRLGPRSACLPALATRALA